LCADEIDMVAPSQDGRKRVYVRQMDDKENELERISTNSLFEIELCEPEKEPGGLLTWINPETKQPTQFRLRHLNSGKLVTSYCQRETSLFVKGEEKIHRDYRLALDESESV